MLEEVKLNLNIDLEILLYLSKAVGVRKKDLQRQLYEKSTENAPFSHPWTLKEVEKP